MSPKRPAGVRKSAASLRARGIFSRLSSVMKKPGEIALTRTPPDAHSAASDLVSPTTPCLLIAYGQAFGQPRWAARDAMLMIDPLPRASIARPKAVQAKKTLVRFVEM